MVRRIAKCIGAVLLVLAVALPALGSPSLYLPEKEQEEWAERLAEAQTRIEKAEERRQRAEVEYTRARRDDYPAGEALAEIEREFDEAKRELRAARQAMDTLREDARRAGVLPGVLRPYQ